MAATQAAREIRVPTTDTPPGSAGSSPPAAQEIRLPTRGGSAEAFLLADTDTPSGSADPSPRLHENSSSPRSDSADSMPSSTDSSPSLLPAPSPALGTIKLSSSCPAPGKETAFAHARLHARLADLTHESKGGAGDSKESKLMAPTARESAAELLREIKTGFSAEVIAKAVEFTKEENIYIASLFLSIIKTRTPIILYYDGVLLDSMQRLIELLNDHSSTKEIANLFIHKHDLPRPEEKETLPKDAKVIIAVCYGKNNIRYNRCMNAFESCRLRNFNIYLGDVSAELEEKDPVQRLAEWKEQVRKSIHTEKKSRKLTITTHLELKTTSEYKEAETLVESLIASDSQLRELIQQDAYNHLKQKLEKTPKKPAHLVSKASTPDTLMDAIVALPPQFHSALVTYISSQIQFVPPEKLEDSRKDDDAIIQSYWWTGIQIFNCYKKMQEEYKDSKSTLRSLGLDPQIILSLPTVCVVSILTAVFETLRGLEHQSVVTEDESNEAIRNALINGLRINGIFANKKKSHSPPPTRVLSFRQHP